MTVTKFAPAGFIATDNCHEIVWAYGSDAESVMADVMRECGPWEDQDGNTLTDEAAKEKAEALYSVFPATAALLQQVGDYGGQIAFSCDGETAWCAKEPQSRILHIIKTGAMTERELSDWLTEKTNQRGVEIDLETGDVWVSDPSTGHWISENQLARLVQALDA